MCVISIQFELNPTRIQFQALIIDYITILVPVSLKLRNNRFYSINNRL